VTIHSGTNSLLRDFALKCALCCLTSWLFTWGLDQPLSGVSTVPGKEADVPVSWQPVSSPGVNNLT
jgi:hypothetical protein